MAVAGDPVLDCYLNGTTHRISREAPVLIVREDSREYRLGGAANTAHNLAALGAKAHLIGLVGPDHEGAVLQEQLKRAQVSPSLLQRKRGNTVTKTRVMGGGLHTTKQQMLRIDRENDGVIEPADAQALFDRACEVIEDVPTLIISDYGDGALSQTYVRLAQHAQSKKKRVIVDSRYGLNAYRGVSAITPNEPEAEGALGRPLRTPERAIKGAQELLAQLDLQSVLLTRGRQGMVVVERDAHFLLSAHGGHEAVDVTGAGDTVVATFALALTAGATVLQAATLANCAASVVVGFVGATTCDQNALARTIRNDPRS